MAEALVKLKKRAIKAGMKKSEAKTADRSTLEEFLSNGSKKSSTKKSSVKKSGGTKKSSTKKSEKKEKKSTKKSSKKSDDVGRRVIGKLSFTNYDEDDWNPRKDSPVARLFKALKKRKGDVEKTFEDLKSDAKEFAASTKAPDGSKRDKAWFLKNLKYRINRTKFEFAVRTGQHEVATDRVEYGKGDYAQNSKKSNKKSSSKKSSTKKDKKDKKSSKKSGSKKSSKKKK